MKSLISKNVLRKKEEERRTKQSLDLPQTIEANNNICIILVLCLVHYKHTGFMLDTYILFSIINDSVVLRS